MAEGAGPADARQLFRVLRRHSRPVVAGMLVTSLGAALVTSQVPVEHEATGKVVIEAPVGEPSDVAENPFAAFNPALSVVGDIVAQVVTDEATRQEVAASGATPDYAIGAGGVWAAPVLTVRAVSRDPERATRTVQLVVSTIAKVLAEQQAAAGADRTTFVTARILIDADRTTTLYGGRVRSGLAILVIGCGSVVALALSLDRRRRLAEVAMGQRHLPEQGQPAASEGVLS